jgi:hypothetical protein
MHLILPTPTVKTELINDKKEAVASIQERSREDFLKGFRLIIESLKPAI